MSNFIPRETIQRLIKDVKQITKNPLTDHGIYYIHDDTDMLRGYAMIVGPQDTPYFGGNYFFDIKYPNDFPHSPPVVTYLTNGDNIRFNPNLYKCGKVCVSLLNTWRGDQWTSCQTISTVLLTLCSLLCKNPLLNEPGITATHTDFKNYDSIIEYSNVNIAICNIVSKKKGYYHEVFNKFYPVIKDNFVKNYDSIHEIVLDKCNTNYKQQVVLKTGLYSMNVCIDYHKVLEKLDNCKAKIETY